MTSLELKKILIQRISEINDISFLEAIKTILDSKSESKILMIDDDLKKEIMASKKEVENGQYISLEEMDDKINSWASEK